MGIWCNGNLLNGLISYFKISTRSVSSKPAILTNGSLIFDNARIVDINDRSIKLPLYAINLMSIYNIHTALPDDMQKLYLSMAFEFLNVFYNSLVAYSRV